MTKKQTTDTHTRIHTSTSTTKERKF